MGAALLASNRPFIWVIKGAEAIGGGGEVARRKDRSEGGFKVSSDQGVGLAGDDPVACGSWRVCYSLWVELDTGESMCGCADGNLAAIRRAVP